MAACCIRVAGCCIVSTCKYDTGAAAAAAARVWQCVAVCCTCVAVCYIVLTCTYDAGATAVAALDPSFQCVAACCNGLQLCCSVLQRIDMPT